MARFSVNFYSYSLDHGVDIEVTIPSFSSCDRDPARKWTHALPAKFPVLYLLHGHGNDRHSWMRYTSVERLAEEQRIALVTLDSQNKAYNNLPNGDNYYDFLNEELPDFVKANFPISDRPEDTYIAGLSMGGYGTLIHALKNPEKYCAFGTMSPGISTKWEFGKGIDPFEEVEARVKEGRKLPAGYICCGKQDFLYDRVCGFVAKLEALGVEHTWHAVDGYEHEWRYWDLEIGNFLKWIPRTDYYADKPHKI